MKKPKTFKTAKTQKIGKLKWMKLDIKVGETKQFDGFSITKAWGPKS